MNLAATPGQSRPRALAASLRSPRGNGGTNSALVSAALASGNLDVFLEWKADILQYLCVEDDAPIQDKAYRKYALGVDRALTLFETALQEWADYISFLNRLLKVRHLSCCEVAYVADKGTLRHYKPETIIYTACLQKLSFRSACRNVSTPPYRQASTRKPSRFIIMCLRS